MEIKSIHNQFHKMLYNYNAVRVNNSDDAADILQEVFINISAKVWINASKGLFNRLKPLISETCIFCFEK